MGGRGSRRLPPRIRYQRGYLVQKKKSCPLFKDQEGRTRQAKSLRAQNQRSPPLTTRCSPVSQWESSEARKTATGAISVTCPIRPNGVWATKAFSKSEPINPPV